MIKHGVTGCWPVIFVFWTQFFSWPHLNETHRYRASFSAQSFQTGTTLIVPALTTDLKDLSYQISPFPSRTRLIIRGQPKPLQLNPRIHANSSSPTPISLHDADYPGITLLIPFPDFSDHPEDEIFYQPQKPQDKTNTTIDFIFQEHSCPQAFVCQTGTLSSPCLLDIDSDLPISERKPETSTV
jgi:hypothetical protein